ncbi:unnamed protein product [Closterium sp. NIES-65]|nr:unnamed protein product [Closterium sp. NIES-65]
MDDPEVLLPSIERRTKQLRQQEQMLREAVTAASRRKETSAAALRSAEDAHQHLLRDRFPALNAQVNAQLDAMAAHAAAIAAFLSPARPGSLAMVAGVEPLLEAQEEVALQHEVWKRRQFDEGPSRAVALEGLGLYLPCDLNDLDAAVIAGDHGASIDTPDAIYRCNIRELKHVHDLDDLYLSLSPSYPFLSCLSPCSPSFQPLAHPPTVPVAVMPNRAGEAEQRYVAAMVDEARWTARGRALGRALGDGESAGGWGERWGMGRALGDGESAGGWGERWGMGRALGDGESAGGWVDGGRRVLGMGGEGRSGNGGVWAWCERVPACVYGCMCMYILSSHPTRFSITPHPLPLPSSHPTPLPLLASLTLFRPLLSPPPPSLPSAPFSPLRPWQQQQWRQQQGNGRGCGAGGGGGGGGGGGEEAEEAAGGGDYELKMQRQRFYLAKMHQLLTQQYWQLAVNVALHGAVLLDAHHLERTWQLLLQLHCDTSAAISDSETRKAAYKALASQATAPTAPTAPTSFSSSQFPPPSSSLPLPASSPLWPALLSALSPPAAQGEPLGAAGGGVAQAAGGREGESGGEVVERLVEGLRGRAQGEGERVQQGVEQSERLLAHMAGMQAAMVELLSSPHATPSSTAAHAMPLHLSPPALVDERLRVERQLSDDVAPAIDRLADEWQTTQRSAVHAPRHGIRQRLLHSFFSPAALPRALLHAHSAQGAGGEGARTEGAGREAREAQGGMHGQERESRGGGGEGSGMGMSMGMNDGGGRGECMGMQCGMHVGMGMGMEEDDDSFIF